MINYKLRKRHRKNTTIILKTIAVILTIMTVMFGFVSMAAGGDGKYYNGDVINMAIFFILAIITGFSAKIFYVLADSQKYKK